MDRKGIKSKGVVDGFKSSRTRGGFSLIEVTISLGILAFCMVAILGLIPVGLGSQQAAQEESRATAALNMVATAVRSATRDSGTAGEYKFPKYLSDNPAPITYTVGTGAQAYTYLLQEDGMIRQSSASTAFPRQTLYIKVFPPAKEAQPVQVYAAVAWPSRPTDTSNVTVDKLKGRQGFIDTMIVYAPRN